MAFLKNLFLGWKPSHVVSQWAWAWQSCWYHFRKAWCHQESLQFWFLGLLPVHLESLVIIMKMGGDLGSNNKLKHREQKVCKTTYMTRVKVWERRPISFIFRLSIVLLNLFLINVFIEFCSHAAIFWRFVIFLGAIWFGNMSWHEPDLPKWLGLGAKKILAKNLVVGQKTLTLKRGFMDLANFLKGLHGIFWENWKLHNCSITN